MVDVVIFSGIIISILAYSWPEMGMGEEFLGEELKFFRIAVGTEPAVIFVQKFVGINIKRDDRGAIHGGLNEGVGEALKDWGVNKKLGTREKGIDFSKRYLLDKI